MSPQVVFPHFLILQSNLALQNTQHVVVEGQSIGERVRHKRRVELGADSVFLGEELFHENTDPNV